MARESKMAKLSVECAKKNQDVKVFERSVFVPRLKRKNHFMMDIQDMSTVEVEAATRGVL